MSVRSPFVGIDRALATCAARRSSPASPSGWRCSPAGRPCTSSSGTSARSAIALAAEAKIPTASNRQIGTGKADVTQYFIASKRVGAFDGHVDVGYSFVGTPAGLAVQNTRNLAVALEAHLSPRVELVGEALSTSAAAGAGGGEGSATAPEIAGAEPVGMLGVRDRGGRFPWRSLGVTYDNTQAVPFRPGGTLALP